MSIADKLLTIANNTPKVCENLYPKKTVSGNSVAIGDVSPIEHNLGVRVKSKNLFDISKIPSNSNGTIINNGDGTIYVKGAAITTNRTLAQCCPLLRVGDVATISLRITNALEDTKKNTYIYLYEIKKTWTTNQVFTITQEMLDSKVLLYCRVYGTNIESTPDGILSQIQVELGSTATAYTPYRTDFSGVEISRYGKNLLNVNNAVSVYINANTGVPAASAKDSSLKNLIYVSPNTAYTFTTPWSTGIRVFFYDINGNHISNDAMLSYTKTYITPQNCCFINICKAVTVDVFKQSQVQMELGTQSTEYEPYKESQTATANSVGTVEGLTSVSPNMTLLADNSVSIECEYKSDGNPTANEKFIELQNAFANAKEIIQN